MTASKMAALVVLMVVCIVAVWQLVGRKATADRFAGSVGGGQVEGELYRDSKLGFSLEYPGEWTATEKPKLGADATFFGRRRGDFTESLDVRSEISAVELNAYVNRSIKNLLPSFLSDFELSEETREPINGVPAVRVRYTYSQGEYKLSTVQVVYGMKEKKVTLTFTVLSEYYDGAKAGIEHAIQSFQAL